jgi:hypothetical protein
MKTALAVMIACAALPLAAHHSISGAYFTDQQTRVEGTVVDFNFRNPHALVELEGPDPKTGQPRHWAIEWGSVKRLGRNGISKETLKPGDHIVVLGNPSRTTGDSMLHMVGASRMSDGWKWGRSVR